MCSLLLYLDSWLKFSVMVRMIVKNIRIFKVESSMFCVFYWLFEISVVSVVLVLIQVFVWFV